jgi:hypothetical protein
VGIWPSSQILMRRDGHKMLLREFSHYQIPVPKTPYLHPYFLYPMLAYTYHTPASWNVTLQSLAKVTQANYPKTGIHAENPNQRHTSAAAAQRTSSDLAKTTSQPRSATTNAGRVRLEMSPRDRRGRRALQRRVRIGCLGRRLESP